MKRLWLFLIVPLVLSLSACNKDNINSKSDVISAVQLNEREDAILTTTSENSFVFDFNVDSQYKDVAVWVEKYESGKLVNDKLGHLTTKTDKIGTIILATSKTDDNSQYTFNTGINDKNGTTSYLNFSDIDSKDIYMQSMSGIFSEEITLTEEEVTLAYIAHANGNSMSSLSKDFHENPEAQMGELAEYDVIYLFKVQFIK